MKILHIIPSLNKGGAERIALDMCVELQRQGHEVKICTFRENNQYTFLTEQLDYQVLNTRIQLSLWRKNRVDVSALQQMIDAFQPDVIHSHLFEAEINLAFCSFPKHTRRVIHFHDNMVQMERFSIKTICSKQLITNYYERRLVLSNLPNTSVAIAISKDTEFYIKRVLPSRIRTCFQLNAIQLERFQPKRQKIDSTAIVMIGSFVFKKGQELAIRTLSELKKRRIELQLNLIGDGEMKDELNHLAKELLVSEQVHFKGLIDFPEQILQQATVYLHTAIYEPFGLVLIEAMACGLPVVCTDGKGNRDLIQEGENGFMIWERDPKLLADKIQFLLENNEERQRMGENAHRFAQQFGMEEYVKKLLALYSNSYSV